MLEKTTINVFFLSLSNYNKEFNHNWPNTEAIIEIGDGRKFSGVGYSAAEALVNSAKWWLASEHGKDPDVDD
ncbi:MAG: hypothetical protein KDC18_10675 [Alphaproteobacteria bacterium]|nr:hypothetical protein [Alphaproteobacteria bacterium]MCB9928006.1 hypothetical protein [Alphaproteobacteria bacterium]